MKKKLLAVILSAAIAATMLAGCGETVETGGNAENRETEIKEERVSDELEEAEQESVASKPESDVAEPGGMTLVSTVSMIRTFSGLDDPVPPQERSIKYEYDVVGNQTKEIWLGEDGSINYEYEYEYDAAGNLTKRMEGYGNGSIIFEYEYEYDDAGNLTKEIYLFLGDSIEDVYECGYEREYDVAGNVTREIHHNSDGSISYEHNYEYEYEYDAAGNLTKIISTDLDSGSKSTVQYEYDAAGNLIRKKGGLDSFEHIQYEYDAVGNLTKEITLDSKGAIWRAKEYEYDVAGNLTKETSLVYEILYYTYDPDTGGALPIYDDVRIDYEKEYEYDTAGNLIRETEQSDSPGGTSITTRSEYEYITINPVPTGE